MRRTDGSTILRSFVQREKTIAAPSRSPQSLRVKRLILIPLFCLTVRGEELLPELATQAAAQKREAQALSEQKEKALADTRQTYLTALDTADQASTAAGNLAAVTAIAQEREQVKKGALSIAPPEALPKNLQPQRRLLLKALERVEADFALKQKTVDGNYLRFLATLQPKAAGNAELAAQILKEKQRLMAGFSGPITDLNTGLPGTNWHRIGAPAKDQARFAKNGIYNDNWKYEITSPTKVRVIWDGASSVTFTLNKDGKTLSENGKVTFELLPPGNNK